RTAIATPDRAISTRDPGTVLPSAVSASMTSPASTTASNASPSLMRRAASTPPIDSSATRAGDTASNRDTNSVKSRLVAIDETIRMFDKETSLQRAAHADGDADARQHFR